MKKLVIVRGIPGSGKTTFAKSIGGAHFEADKYFVGSDGVYRFVPQKIKEAHAWCQNCVDTAMILNHTTGENETIVVSNTFTEEWEMQPYYELAEKHGYMVFSVIVENRHGGKNEHGVPTEKVELMKNRFQVKLN